MKAVSRVLLFQIYNMNRKNFKKQRNLERQLNNLMRQLCCWNCFQVGHKRFQCPYAKQNSCSFCRKPSILSIECGCELSRLHISLPNHRQEVAERIPYHDDVMVPVVNIRNGAVEYQRNDNLVIVVDNNDDQNEEDEVDNDVLEINADTDSLDDL